jgi:TetR/AcrR family transcriptional regulator, cholesterol catabolism regulator
MLSDTVEAEILRLAQQEPELGQATVAHRMQSNGYKISPSGVRYIWQKHNLETTVKRLRALESNSSEISQLTHSQRRQLERSKRAEQLIQNNGMHKDMDSTESSMRQRLILYVAAELFAEKGYDRTSMRDIAASAGLQPGSIYHYFSSKEALFITVHREGLTTVREMVKIAAQQGSDPWDSLTRAFTVHIGCMVGEGSDLQRLTGHSLAMTGNQDILQKIHPERDAYEAVLSELIDKLPLKQNVDRSMLRLTLLGATNWVFLWYRPGKKTPQDIAITMVNMIRNGVTE